MIEKKVPILVLQNIKITLMHFESIFLLISGECIFFINIQTQNLKSIKHSEIFIYFIFVLRLHSSEKWGFYFMKWPSETLQNLPYFWNTKIPCAFFRFSHFINSTPTQSLTSYTLWAVFFGTIKTADRLLYKLLNKHSFK